MLPQDPGGYPVRVTLPTDVAPGETVTATADLAAQVQPGSYTIQLDVVEEGVTWFESRGDIPAQLTVVVGDAAGDGGVPSDGGPSDGGPDGSSEDGGAADGAPAEAGVDGAGGPDGSSGDGSAGGTGGSGASSASAGPASDDGGCGCRTSGGRSGWGVFGLLVLIGLLLRRRR